MIRLLVHLYKPGSKWTELVSWVWHSHCMQISLFKTTSPIVGMDSDDRNASPLWGWGLVTGKLFFRSCGYFYPFVAHYGNHIYLRAQHCIFLDCSVRSGCPLWIICPIQGPCSFKFFRGQMPYQPFAWLSSFRAHYPSSFPCSLILSSL